MRSVLRMLLPGAMLAMTLAGLVVAGSAMDLPFPPPTNGGGHLVADLPFPPPTNGGGHLVADLPFPPPTNGGGHLV